MLSIPISGYTHDLNLTERLHGYILLQVEEHGEAWYVRSADNKRYYMENGDTAYEIMRFFSLGITDADLVLIPSVADTTEMKTTNSICASNSLANRLKGEILLQVQQHGEAWYVDPQKCLRIYMKDGDTAYEIMRFLGLGITNADLGEIETGTIEIHETAENAITPLSWPSELGVSHFGRLVTYGDLESDLTGGWVRPHPGPFVWDLIEKIEGTYDWDDLDEEILHWQELNQAILATVWPFASWDQESCHSQQEPIQDETFPELGDLRYSPCDEEAYQAWLSAMVERYDGDGISDLPGLKYPLRYWEILNEPSMQTTNLTFFQEDSGAYTDLLKISSETIRAADDEAVILTGGQAGMESFSIDYWEEVLSQAIGLFDRGNIHSIASDEVFFSDQYRDFLDEYGFEETDFWITEALVGDLENNLSEDALAQLTFTGYIGAFANGAEKIFNVGFHDPSGGSGQESEETFELMAETIGDFETATRLNNNLVQFLMPDGSYVYALWDNAQPPTSLTGTVTVITYDGITSQQSAETIVASEPLFVIE